MARLLSGVNEWRRSSGPRRKTDLVTMTLAMPCPFRILMPPVEGNE